MGANASQGTDCSDTDKLVLVPQRSEELRNGRLCCRTHAAQVQGRHGPDPLVLILEHLCKGADGTFLTGAKVRQSPHCLLPERRIPVLELPDPKTRRLAPVKSLLLRLLPRQ